MVKSKMCVFVAVLLMAATPHAWAEVASDGLVVYYRADNADGAGNPGSGELATWKDLALEFGEANNGKLNNFKFKPGCGWVENADQPKDSPFRYGLEFEATTHYDGDYVNISPLAPVDEDTFTYEFWIKPDEESYASLMTLIGQYGGNAGNNVLGSGLGGWVRCGPCGPEGGPSGAGPDAFRPSGKYVQLAVTKSGKEVRYYVNGPDTPAGMVRVEQPEKYGGPAPNRQCLGMYWAADGRLMNAYNGQMNLVRVYNRPLSGEELAGNYAAETGAPAPRWEPAASPVADGSKRPGQREPKARVSRLNFERLLFVKRQTYTSSHFYTDFIDGCTRYGGNLCVLEVKTGKVTDLVPEMKGGIFGRFDLHFDADKVVFDWKKAPKEGFRIYEIDIDPATGLRTGSNVRRLTFRPHDEDARIKKYDNSFTGVWGGRYYHQTDDMHPCYLPDGGIAFVSTRCEYGTLCDAADVLATAVLYRMDGDGKNMQKLTNSPVSEFSPSMMADGRILYTRWEYVDKGQICIKCLWAIRPDGSGSVEVYGNDIAVPPTLLHGRQIPGRENMFVVLGTPHYPQSGIGTVIRLDMSKDIRTREPITHITPHVTLRGEGGWGHRLADGKWTSHTKGPLYMDPYPLSDKLFLVAYNPDKEWSDPRAYGLYVIDEEGNHEPIYRDPEISCWQPYPLRTRKTPPALPSTREPELARKNLALCMVQDVYHGMEGVERGTVKYLRIMEQVPRPWAARRFWDPHDRHGSHVRLVSERTVLGLKVLRGVVPVRADGSALFYVPADKNIYFEALDESYMELQRERTYVNYRPGEVRSCVGCHETPKDSLPKQNIMTIAQKMPPSMPAPQPGDETACRPIDYITDVQPVLEKHCVRCHGGPDPKGKLDLTGDLTTMSCRSYESIMGRAGLVKTFDEHSSWGGAAYSKPKSVGSCASRFISQVRNGCPGNDEKLPLADFVKLTTWVDANAQYYGTYYGRKNIRYKDHPNFRPVPTFAEATSTVCPVPMEKR